MRKLGLRNVAELTLAALESGLIERPRTVSRLMGGAAPRHDDARRSAAPLAVPARAASTGTHDAAPRSPQPLACAAEPD